MRGTIKSRTNGSYTLTFDVTPVNGKRKQQTLTIRGTRKEAEKKLNELLSQIDNGTYAKPGKTTVKDFLERWLVEYGTNISLRTLQDYRDIANEHLIPGLGTIRLTELRPEHLAKFYAAKLANGRLDGKGGLSGKTVHAFHVLLHDALESAVRWELISRNPADKVTPPRFQRPEMHVLDEDGINRVLGAARNSEYYELFYVLLYTGLRRSEALAVRWQDLDLLAAELSVSRAMHHLHTGEYIFTQPKTPRSRRLVSLTPSTCAVLREYYEKQKAQHLVTGAAFNNDNLVFAHVDNTPLGPEVVSAFWFRLINRLGLKGVRLHDARHSHASMMLKMGVSPKIVAERLGHSSVVITLDVYSHILPGLQEAAALNFDKAVNYANKVLR